MEVPRRDLLTLLGVAAGAGLTPRQTVSAATAPERLLEYPALGNVSPRICAASSASASTDARACG